MNLVENAFTVIIVPIMKRVIKFVKLCSMVLGRNGKKSRFATVNRNLGKQSLAAISSEEVAYEALSTLFTANEPSTARKYFFDRQIGLLTGKMLLRLLVLNSDRSIWNLINSVIKLSLQTVFSLSTLPAFENSS